MDKWVSVAERLPEMGVPVLFCSNNRIYAGDWADVTWAVVGAKGVMIEWYVTGSCWSLGRDGVTHWMPQPPLPGDTP